MSRIGVFTTLPAEQAADLALLAGGVRIDAGRPPPAGTGAVAVLDRGGADDGMRAAAYAARHGLGLLRLRPGLIGAARPRRFARHLPLLGVFDPAAFEEALRRGPGDAARGQLGRALIEQARGWRIGTANTAAPAAAAAAGHILVADEIGPAAAALAAVLEAALADHPAGRLRILPAVDLDGRTVPGPLTAEARRRGIALAPAPAAVATAVAAAAAVYAWSAPAGFDALIQGTPLITFGPAFYAGLGLADDRGCDRRTPVPVTVEDLAAAAYLDGSRHVDPVTGRACDALAAMDHVRRVIEQDRRFSGDTVVVAMKPWKRANVGAFLASRLGRLRYRAGAKAALRLVRRRNGRIATWASTEPPGLADRLAAEGLPPLLRIEDGFLRSVGLGSNYVAASSLVLDRQGIYYDPGRPSDLESLLEQHPFSEEERATARRLAALIVERGLTKYNVGVAAAGLVQAPAGACRILVPGQVEDDASVRLGAPDLGGNLGLLRAVRAARPEAWIVYKPHPDVEAGNRKGRIGRDLALSIADQVVDDASVVSLFGQVDAVHTMTSLVGFEALLRGLEVATYGLPFYAGWGLTLDRRDCPRRRRRLAVDELVAGTLLLYPAYVDPETGLPCDVWTVVERLSAQAPRSVHQPGGRWARVAPFFQSLWQSLRGG
ncbi:capsular biosynthesis protein [Zavarzinia compransoris]|uniref:Capsular biosynthesis protein n=1 Tax=Zavarzinia compransoris TaxID=1264899 RepID=A0A317DUY9_9PROT|nr:capsular biosynthesis protein [Zavarzinia compransoris]PWR18222.1 capsular biosynthesis protein [Zavarzinia compransoris]TDP40885.1 capsular polysaccharide export protein [Zavarzinia compransoris]